jgi:hypothetical protein
MEGTNVITFLVICSIFSAQCHAENDIYNCHLNFFTCFIKYFPPQESCAVFLGPVNISHIEELSDSVVFVSAIIDEPSKNSTIFYNSDCVFIQTSSDWNNTKELLRNLLVVNSNVHILMKQDIDDNWPLTINSQVYEYTDNYEIYEVYKTEKSTPSIRKYITKWTPNEGFKLNEFSIYERRKNLHGIQLTATVVVKEETW